VQRRDEDPSTDLSALEDQMCQMTGSGFMGSGSPDRVDALVWALTELMVGPQLNSEGLLDLIRREAAAKPEPEKPEITYAPGSVEWMKANGMG